MLAEEGEPEKSLEKNWRASYCKMVHTVYVQSVSFAFSEYLCYLGTTYSNIPKFNAVFHNKWKEMHKLLRGACLRFRTL